METRESGEVVDEEPSSSRQQLLTSCRNPSPNLLVGGGGVKRAEQQIHLPQASLCERWRLAPPNTHQLVAVVTVRKPAGLSHTVQEIVYSFVYYETKVKI